MHRGMHRADHEDASRAAMTSSGGSPLTTHVLDTSTGTPAVDLPITLYVRDGAGRKDDDGGAWKRLAAGNTNSDGKLPDMLTQDQFLPAIYKLHFNTAAYFAQSNTKGFFPYVEVVFEIVDPYQHYHVPLLLSPFGYTTYRGS
ncbi:PREDICTED: 5-hydroxyisourate hydrolase-like isoform X2 [Priapulus caudatus]|uniref:5-hydroxyisourate hydrolase n=1 Tax=Priapulus caudatus TaxID=37621 RepID=A0ABM1EMQ7_PRICU|nr:PREDICTED: 5-hydroxyisourate hydrolase-like isoform X2 [Priapulus caudatus]